MVKTTKNLSEIAEESSIKNSEPTSEETRAKLGIRMLPVQGFFIGGKYHLFNNGDYLGFTTDKEIAVKVMENVSMQYV